MLKKLLFIFNKKTFLIYIILLLFLTLGIFVIFFINDKKLIINNKSLINKGDNSVQIQIYNKDSEFSETITFANVKFATLGGLIQSYGSSSNDYLENSNNNSELYFRYKNFSSLGIFLENVWSFEKDDWYYLGANNGNNSGSWSICDKNKKEFSVGASSIKLNLSGNNIFDFCYLSLKKF